MANQVFIIQSDDPKNVGEIMGIQKEKDCLEDISLKIYKQLLHILFPIIMKRG